MSEKGLAALQNVRCPVSLPIQDLQQENTIAEDVRLEREGAFHCVLRSHVTTVNSKAKNVSRLRSQLVCGGRQVSIHSLGSHDSASVDFVVFLLEDLRHAEV